MALTIDKINMLEASEQHGAVVRLVRQALVSGLTDTDYQAIRSALSEADIPEHGDTLTNFPNLVLTERNVRMIDLNKAEVDLVYEHYFNEAQIADSTYGLLAGHITTNLQQKTSNLDGDGDRIILSHTFPDGTDTYQDEEGNTLEADADYPGQTVKQGGEIEYFEPQKTISLEFWKEYEEPWEIADNLIGHVNSEDWNGDDARTWLCTTVSWHIHNATADQNAYLFKLEFQHNPDTWDPTVVFIDNRNGESPLGLVQDEGIKTIEKLPEVDFEEVLKLQMQGG